MSTFEVLVRTIDEVKDHPNADRLSLIKVLGYEAISAKNEDGSHRFVAGEEIVYVPEGAVVPDDHLKARGFWNEEKDIGLLAGSKGNRVKAMRLRGVLSQGLVWKTGSRTVLGKSYLVVEDAEGNWRSVSVGDDVADFFGITKYEPPIPAGMGGEVASVHDFAVHYDIENEQNFPGFLDNDEVVATEKLHGTNARISFRPNVRHEEMFGTDGNIAITSKGLGSKGLVFKNNEKNANNLYVRTFRDMGLIERIESLGNEMNVAIDLFGEIFGPGVQDLHYGLKQATLRGFDVFVDFRPLPEDEKVAMFEKLGVERVPVLYSGPFDRDTLIGHRDGKTMFNGANVREGIVVTAVGDQSKREIDNHRLRPIVKMINPDYLVRKGGTEFN